MATIIRRPTVKARPDGWITIPRSCAGLRSSLNGLSCVHVLVWRQLNPKDRTDEWSQGVLRFKDDNAEAVDVVCSLLSAKLRALLDSVEVPRDLEINVVTALSARDERAIVDRPLYRLAASLERRMAGLRFLPRLLCKKPHPRLVELGAAADRDAAVSDKYRADRASFEREDRAQTYDDPVFLVIDDFVTRGSTLADISRALLEAFPRASIHAVALAKHVCQDTYASMHERGVRAGYPWSRSPGEDNRRRLGRWLDWKV